MRGGPGYRCGEYMTRPLLVCDGERKAWRIKIRCRDRGCPECGDRWANYYGVQGDLYLRMNLPEGVEIRRWIVSPGIPGEWWKNREIFRRVRKRVIRVLKRNGWKGGYVVFHPYREDESGEFTVEGPHFQGVGYKRYNPKDRIPSGWIYKNLPVMVDGLKGRIIYDLEHAGVLPRASALVWFGALSYAVRKRCTMAQIRMMLASDPIPCPDCGDDLRWMTSDEALSWDGEICDYPDDLPEDTEPPPEECKDVPQNVCD